MEAVWTAGDAGASVAQIWVTISARRSVTRTTILNLVDRLEKRGWLRRCKEQGAHRFVATIDRTRTAQLLAQEFVDEYFGGSNSQLILSLLGGKPLKPEDLRRLRRLFDATPDDSNKPEDKP
jgi:predicted transcriptional regulator